MSLYPIPIPVMFEFLGSSQQFLNVFGDLFRL